MYNYLKFCVLTLLLFIASSAVCQLETNVFGTTVSDIKSISVGAIDDFKEGFALFRKGEKFGIIDKVGNEFIPLGKYNFDYTGSNNKFGTEQGFHNGMCMVRDVETNKIGYINLTGKLVVPCIFSVATRYKEDGYSYAEFIDDNYKFYYYFLDKQGYKFAVNSDYRREQPLFFLQSRAIDYKTTNFYRKNGTKAFETKLQIQGYGDGMYLTNQRIDNSIFKSGFIDTSGKLVIPYKYAGELRNFSEGLALYEPKNKDEYQYAFINKVGEEIIKLKANSTTQRYEEVEDFHNGYATCNFLSREGTMKLALIDKGGNIIPFEPLFSSANPQLIADIYPNSGMSVSPSDFNEAGMIIKCDVRLKDKSITARAFTNSEYKDGRGGIGMANPFWESNGYGMINYSGKITILPIFADIHQFDKISGLAMATYVSKSGGETKGFINQNGQFTIIIKKNP